MKYFAPVLIPTLNRYTHFKRCVESLSFCTFADKTDLIIALDFPLKKEQEDGYNKIREYLNKIDGFKSVQVIKREVNFGVRNNMLNARRTIFKNYDRMIISEDDNVFAPSFLSFVNNGLEKYKNRQDIFSICGYNNPYIMPSFYKSDVYLRMNFSGWGVGIWRDKWYKMDWSLSNFKTMLNKKKNYKELKKSYQIELNQLLDIEHTGIIKGDGFIFLYLLDKKMYSIFPVKTRVRNTGHDGSGVNCRPRDSSYKYMDQQYYMGDKDAYFAPDLLPDTHLIDYLKKQVTVPLSTRIALVLPRTIKIWIKIKKDKNR